MRSVFENEKNATPILSPYGQIGPALIARGYCALPVMPGTKVPGELGQFGWRRMKGWAEKYRDKLPHPVTVRGWAELQHAGVCVVCGRASQGLNVVDVDTDDPVIIAAIRAVIPFSPVEKRGQKGFSLFYRGNVASIPISRRLADGSLERLADILAEGRQTVLPPTRHPVTRRPYEWTGECELHELLPEMLPELTEAHIARVLTALEPFGYVPAIGLAPKGGLPASEARRPACAGGNDEDRPHRRLNNIALDNLSSWIPALNLFRLEQRGAGYAAVATWRASNTGRAREKRDRNLSIMPGGIVDFGDGHRGYTPLDLTMAALGVDLDPAFAWLAERVGFGASLNFEIEGLPDSATQDIHMVAEPVDDGEKTLEEIQAHLRATLKGLL